MATAGGHILTSTPTLPGLPWGPVDHAWVDDGHGILSCVAGHEHAPDQLAVCPYYLRHDVLEGLPTHVRTRWQPDHPSLAMRGERYTKITEVSDVGGWATLIDALPARHGLRSCAWSVFSALQRDHVVAGIDPRQALRYALDGRDDGDLTGLLRALADSLGDERHAIGLTGSGAIMPNEHQRSDIDLLVYSPQTLNATLTAIATLGGTFLTDLGESDARRAGYVTSRIMPAVADAQTRRRGWARRRDVAWLDGWRIDIGLAHPAAGSVARLPYAQPPIGSIVDELTVISVNDAYPVTLRATGQRVAHVLITARGFQGTFRAGDRIRITGALHHPADADAFASIDDAAGHAVELLTEPN